MSESDKNKEILRLALENEAQNLVKTALEGSDSYRVLVMPTLIRAAIP